MRLLVHDRTFVELSGGRLVTNAGGSLATVATMWLVHALGASPALTGTLEVDSGSDPDDRPLTTFQCAQCDRSVNADLASWCIEHPVVVQFSTNHGIDPRDEPLWSDHWRQTIAVTVNGATDPSVTITLTLHEETLDILVDETVHVRDVTTSDA